jgi:cation diffusion facilitator CzcD-associated flavoprotein CzcO
VPDHEVVIVGAGFSGIGAAIKLDEAGFDDLVVLEAGTAVGGAWHWNRYPGVAVDIPSFSYEFSFEPNPDWSRVYAPGDELRAYAEHCVDKYGLRSRIRLNTTAIAAEFDDAKHIWRLTTDDGNEVTARFVVGATGVFSQPQPPDVPGIGDFAGTVMHTARWDHGHDLRGERVGVIGTGASAVQVVPTIAPLVDHLVVFQRTPIWCLPKNDPELPESLRSVFRKLPAMRKPARAVSQAFVEVTFPIPAHFHGVVPMTVIGERVGRKHLREQVRDPVVRDKLTPRYPLGCKRPGFSNDYLRTFNRDNVALVTEPIERIEADRIRTADGGERPIDAIVLATGFRLASDPENYRRTPVRGRDGFDLATHYAENRVRSYESISLPGLPNNFVIFGPYGWTGGTWHDLVETASHHIVRVIEEARRREATAVEVREEAAERWTRFAVERLSRSLWSLGSCETANSYYFDQHGDTPFLRPTSSRQAVHAARSFPLEDYAFEPGRRTGELDAAPAVAA